MNDLTKTLLETSIVICSNPFEPNTNTVFNAPELLPFLKSHYGEKFPANARIYHLAVSSDCDVTPCDEASIKVLEKLKGPFYVVEWPGADPFTWVAIIAAVISIATTAYALLSIPNAAAKNQNANSSNNQISDRQNQSRILGRIADIYGTVLDVPDLIAVPYKKYETVNGINSEVEYSYMIVGRGSYDINATDVYEDTTLCSTILGENVCFYGPNTSPNSGDSPQLTIGSLISEKILYVVSSSAVTGQTLFSINYKKVVASSQIGFYPSISVVESADRDTLRFEPYFQAGDVINIENGTWSTYDLSGVGYTVDSINDDGKNFSLVSPSTINAQWGTDPDMTGDTASPTIYVDIQRFVGPITIEIPSTGIVAGTTAILINLIAEGGLFKIKSANNVQYAASIDYQVDITPVDNSGAPTGSTETFTGTMSGSSTDKCLIGLTVECSPTFTGLCQVTITRTDASDYTYAGTVVDDVKVRDLYAVGQISQTDFGNVTTVQTRTIVNQLSNAPTPNRKFNCYVTRKVPVRVSGTTFGALTATKQADAIICAVALDSFIGRRDVSQIDVDNIYDTVAAIVSYFGISEAAEFCYTFDKTNVTFEETMQMIANAIFCTAYRQGNLLKLAFEQATTDSKMLFNHRNKLPGSGIGTSEQRTCSFGWTNNNDGVEYQYVDPYNLDALTTLYAPSDMSATNAQQIQSVGIRNLKQASLQLNRLWNKLRYQNTQTEFDATNEADLLVRTDRILVADDTRPDTQAGEVLAQNVLTLTLSQPFTYTTLAHTIHLQLYDGTVQAIAIVSVPGGSGTYDIVLASAPTLALCIGNDFYAPTNYVIVGNSDPRSAAFLLDSREPNDNFTSKITAINYATEYYQNDLDYHP